MAEQFGTEAIKKVAKALIDIGQGIEEKMADDGKIRIGEALSLAVDSFPAVYKIARNGAQLKDEWLDFSEEEKVEVATYVAEELDLDADGLEKKIEKGFKMLMEIDTFLREFTGEEGEDPVE